MADPAPPGERLTTRLRRATAAAHAATEARLDLFRPGLTVARYADLLQRWLAFHEAWEPAAERWFARDGDFFPRRSKIGLLRRDLAACGRGPMGISCDLGRIEPKDHATALGTLYVVEGSTLGGRVLTPRIGTLLSLTPERGVAFFSSYGPQCAAMWAETKALLDQTPVGLHAHVTEAAAATFTRLGAWLVE